MCVCGGRSRERRSNYVKIETGWNFLAVLKIVTRTTHVAKMLMLLRVPVTSVLFLVRLNNFALTMGFYRSYTLLL